MAKELTIHGIHTRLRVLEYVTVISLILNLALWFFAGNLNSKVDNKADASAVSAPR